MADEQRRARYLEALGIEQWVRRATPVAELAMATAVASPTAAVDRLDWPALRACVGDCQRCGLHKTRTQTVFGVGDSAAHWMVVGSC